MADKWAEYVTKEGFGQTGETRNWIPAVGSGHTLPNPSEPWPVSDGKGHFACANCGAALTGDPNADGGHICQR